MLLMLLPVCPVLLLPNAAQYFCSLKIRPTFTPK